MAECDTAAGISKQQAKEGKSLSFFFGLTGRPTTDDRCDGGGSGGDSFLMFILQAARIIVTNATVCRLKYEA